jgi:hypothetical protein
MLGLYNAPFEVTRQIRGARALQTLLTMGQETALAKSVSTFWPQLLRALSDNVFDFPFVILYSVVDEVEEENQSQCSETSQSFRYCLLEGTLGIPEGHPATPQRLDLRRYGGGFVPAFRDAMQTREPKILSTKNGTLPESLIEGFAWRGFGEPSREAVVCPIRPTSGENVRLFGFSILLVMPVRMSHFVECCSPQWANRTTGCGAWLAFLLQPTRASQREFLNDQTCVRDNR